MIVEVEEGKLRGVEKTSSLAHKSFKAFLGIPYAKPPLGDLRFKAPEPFGKWDGVRDATKEGHECIQLDGLPELKRMTGNEDCLYLNVYTPEINPEVKKAVMVYIHGGGFYSESGSAKSYGPNFLLDHDVVYVTFNYRLHVLGFLNTGTKSCPGNAGMKDQLLALKWVKKNIASFGGDPENITLFGESAGGTSVHLHMLSPLSKGLFNKAIVQSGTALSPWALEDNPVTYARKIGFLTGYRELDLERLVEHLKEQPAKLLCEMANKILEEAVKNAPGRCTTLVFCPSVEKIKDGAFLPDKPRKLMELATPIPAIFGYNDQEGLNIFTEQTLEVIRSILKDLSIMVRDTFRLPEDERNEMVKKIKEFYFQNKTPSLTETLPEFCNLYTDLFFLQFHESIEHLVQSEEVPTYLYLFGYQGNLNFMRKVVEYYNDIKSVKGACHADDLGYMFSQTKMQVPISERDKQVIKKFCTLWTDFAKTGNPTSTLSNVEWKPNTDSNPCYLKIDDPLKVFQEKLLGERLDFWKDWLSTVR